ncbi:MAG: glycine--tRNA ligase, partial [Patescibacteria group bacterium]
SGHTDNFSDPMVDCRKCHKRFRRDETESEKCPECQGELMPARQFNMMFKTFVGPVEGGESLTYLRPETAGGIFVNFKNVTDTTRVKIPFGIAQIGRAFRNEINPRDFIFRTREFEQMELEYFVKPGDDERAFHEWADSRMVWYKRIGLKNIYLREQSPDERAHYSKQTSDIEFDFPFGRKEIEGIANRGDFDLRAHSLDYFDDKTGERFYPFVIEPSAGVERILFALLCEAYHEDGDRVILKLQPAIAPHKVAVFPLLANKPKLVERAKEIYQNAKRHFLNPAFDDRGNIGKRYYSQDEIGTPWCVTVDFETLENDTVTVRDRDTMKQERIAVADLKNYFSEKLS